MYYLARRLYLSKKQVLLNYVVEVSEGVAVNCFPFSGELQSMQLIDTLFVSEKKIPSVIDSINDILPDDAPEFRRAILYRVEQCGNFSSSKECRGVLFSLSPLNSLQMNLSIDKTDSIY